MSDLLTAVDMGTIVTSVSALLVLALGVPLAKAGYRIARSVVGMIR